jgi:dipeptidyl aminopeptidase/acylaminoacyl peptidase
VTTRVLAFAGALALATGFGPATAARPVAAPAAEKRPVAPEDLADIRKASDPQISPDGRRVAFVVTEPGDPKKPKEERDSNIWVVPADGGAPPRLFAAGPQSDTSPRWSPDGRFLAFLSNRGGPAADAGQDEAAAKSQIYLLRTDGGEAEPLTSFKGGVERLKWSSDGSLIAFTVKDPPTEEEERRAKDRDDAVHVDHDYKFARLWVLSMADRKAKQVTRQDLNVNDFSWSPDGRELAASVSATPRLDDVYWHASLIVVGRQTGEIARRLSERVADFPSARAWSPDGKAIAFMELAPSDITGWPALAPAAGGAVRRLLADYRGTPWGLEWAGDGRHLIVEGIEGTVTRLVHLDTATGAVTRIADALQPGPAAFSVSADGRTVAYLSQSAVGPDEVWAASVGKPPRRLTTLNPPIASLRLGEVSEITWKNRKDGMTIYGVLVTPPGFRPGRPYPTVVEIHGGPQWAWWSGWLGSWHEWAQLLASHGYVVLLPNPRGSDGQGLAFIEANRDDWGGRDLQDIMDGVDDLIDRKVADPERLGIGGWSYGGFMTSWAITQTGRFKAAVVGAAVTNLVSFHGTTDITPSFLKSYFLDLPYRRRSPYDAHSAMTFVQNCRTPSLVLHGEADLRVPVSQGWEFYTALRQLGVETEMVVYPREPHPIGERAHQIDVQRRVLAWFDAHLGK